MVAELTPGTAGGRASWPRASGSRSRQTLPDVNLDEILASLDADTRDYLQLLLNDGARGRSAATAASSRSTIRRFEPTARYAREINEQLAERRRQHQARRSTTSRC